MKYVNLALLAILLPFAPSFAADANTVSAHPCKQIVQACEAAGYTAKGHKQQKGLYKDCVRPVKSGKAVVGVTIDPNVVQACTVKKTKSNPTSPVKSTS